MKKEFEFNDGSIVSFLVSEDGSLCLTIQGKHLDEEKPRFTSATVTLELEDTIELINWIGNELGETKNG